MHFAAADQYTHVVLWTSVYVLASLLYIMSACRSVEMLTVEKFRCLRWGRSCFPGGALAYVDMLGHFHAFCSGRSVHARGVVNKCVCVDQFDIYHECRSVEMLTVEKFRCLRWGRSCFPGGALAYVDMLGHFHAFCSGQSVHACGVVNKYVCVDQFDIYHECRSVEMLTVEKFRCLRWGRSCFLGGALAFDDMKKGFVKLLKYLECNGRRGAVTTPNHGFCHIS